MAIFTLNLGYTGTQGIGARRCQLICDNSLSEVEAPGFIPSSFNVQSTDIFDGWYGTNSSSYAEFTTSRDSNGIITLSTTSQPGEVNLPVVSGNFANFQSTTGTIGDDGYLPTNSALTKVTMARSGSYTVGNILVANDTSGSSRGGIGLQATQIGSPVGPTINAIAFKSGNNFGSPAITSGNGYGIEGFVSASGSGGAILSGIHAFGNFGGISSGNCEYSAIKAELSMNTLAVAADDIVSPIISDCGEPTDAPSLSVSNISMFFGTNRTTTVIGQAITLFGPATYFAKIDNNGSPSYNTSASGSIAGGTLKQWKVSDQGVDGYILISGTPY